MLLPTPVPCYSHAREKFLVKRPLPYRFGELILLFLFVSLLAGRFNLSRLTNEALGLDLRFGFVILGVLLVMLWWAEAREHVLQPVPMVGVVAFTLWCFWMVLSGGWAPSGARIAETSLDFGFLFSLILLSWFLMAHLPTDSLERVWKWLVITGVIYFVLAIAAGPGDQGRYSAPGGGPNTFVRIMVAASIAALYIAIVKRRTWVLWLIPMFAVGAALSGSRGGMASAAVVMLVFLIPVLRRLGLGKSFLLLLFTGVGVAIAASWNNGYLLDFVQERFIQQTLTEGYSSGRDIITEETWGLFTENPLAGVGLDGFYILQSAGSPVFEYPHNLLLASLAEAGILGGLLLVLAVSRPIIKTLGREISSGALFSLVVGVYFLGASMFSGDYYDSRLIWFFLALGVVWRARARKESQDGAYATVLSA